MHVNRGPVLVHCAVPFRSGPVRHSLNRRGCRAHGGPGDVGGAVGREMFGREMGREGGRAITLLVRLEVRGWWNVLVRRRRDRCVGELRPRRRRVGPRVPARQRARVGAALVDFCIKQLKTAKLKNEIVWASGRVRGAKNARCPLPAARGALPRSPPPPRGAGPPAAPRARGASAGKVAGRAKWPVAQSGRALQPTSSAGTSVELLARYASSASRIARASPCVCAVRLVRGEGRGVSD